MIIINGRFLTQPITGVQRFAIELCKAMQRNGQKFKLVCPKGIIHKDLADEFNAEILGNLEGPLWEQITLFSYMIMKKEDILLSLCNSSALFLKNQIVAIHDLGYLRNPNWFSKNFSRWYKFMIPRITKNAKHLLTVSNASKHEIIKFLEINDSKISVIYNGISDVFLQSTSSKLILDNDYILTVSSHHPRKNFEGLIQAFLNVKRKDLQLVVIGNFDKNFMSLLDPSEYSESRVIFLSKITDEELQKYYENATLFVMPSFYEGFGIPIVEAAINRVRLCLSDLPVFREICGNQAIYFDPNSVQDITEKIEISLNTGKEPDPQFFKDKFSWNNSALQLIKILDKLN